MAKPTFPFKKAKAKTVPETDPMEKKMDKMMAKKAGMPTAKFEMSGMDKEPMMATKKKPATTKKAKK